MRQMRSLLALALASSAAAQGVGNGVSKATYACNNPAVGHAWLLKYLAVRNATDECTHNECDCSYDGESWSVQQGRVYFDTPSCYDCEYKQFGLHLVNTSAHLTTGGLTVSAVEAIVDGKLADLSTSFDAWLDFSVTIYVDGLDKMLARCVRTRGRRRVTAVGVTPRRASSRFSRARL